MRVNATTISKIWWAILLPLGIGGIWWMWTLAVQSSDLSNNDKLVMKDIDDFELRAGYVQVKPDTFREFFGYEGQIDVIDYPDGIRTYRVYITDNKKAKIFYKDLKSQYAENIDWSTSDFGIASGTPVGQ